MRSASCGRAVVKTAVRTPGGSSARPARARAGNGSRGRAAAPRQRSPERDHEVGAQQAQSGPRPAVASSPPRDTQTVRWAATGGSEAPLPSSTTAPGSSDTASRTPSATFESKTSPAGPSPQRRHADRRHAREHSVLQVVRGRVRRRRGRSRAGARRRAAPRPDELRLRRAPSPHRDDDRLARRAREGATARCPATAVLPVRLPVPITATIGARDSIRSTGGGLRRRPGARYSSPRSSATAASSQPPFERQHGIAREVEHGVRIRGAGERRARSTTSRP